MALTASGAPKNDTYGASAAALAPALLATDIFTITGSSTRIVSVREITITATRTTLTKTRLSLLKRSTANTGGTSNNLTEIPFNSLSPAATATTLSYTANPTTGTLVGILINDFTFIGPTTILDTRDSIDNTKITWNFEESPIILLGTNEVLAINLNGLTLAGAAFYINIKWDEI